MKDVRDLLERAGAGFPFPDEAFDRLIRRRARRRRNERVGVFVLAALVAVVIALALSSVLPIKDRTTGTQPPSRNDPSGILTEGARHRYVDLATGEETPIPRRIDGGFFYPVSPDGTRFAFNPCCEPPMGGYLAAVDGSEMREITPDDIDVVGIRWSPDGSRLVYQGRDASTFLIGDLFVIDPSTGATTQVTHFQQQENGWWFLSPTFGPDGQTVLFHLPRGKDPEVWDLWSVPVTGGEPTLVRRKAAFGTYSADGGSLAYLSPVKGFMGRGLWVVGASGGEPRQLVEGTRLQWPRWSPDGTKIAYVQGRDVHVVDVATSRSRLVTRGGAPEWFDDNTLIVSR